MVVVVVVLHADDPVGDNEDDDQDGHPPIGDPQGILQLLLFDLMRALLIEAFERLPLNRLVDGKQAVVSVVDIIGLVLPGAVTISKLRKTGFKSYLDTVSISWTTGCPARMYIKK